MAYGQGSAGVCFATAVFLCGAAGFPVAPSSPPAANGTIVMSGDTDGSFNVKPGQKIRVTGNGFASRAAVTVSIYSAPKRLAHVVADKTGHMSAKIVIPGSMKGDHTLSAIGNGPGHTSNALEAHVLVSKRSGSAVLPATGMGFSLALWAVAGMLMIISGLILVRTAVMRRPMMPQ